MEGGRTTGDVSRTRAINYGLSTDMDSLFHRIREDEEDTGAELVHDLQYEMEWDC
jgi:hypothetical protein